MYFRIFLSSTIGNCSYSQGQKKRHPQNNISKKKNDELFYAWKLFVFLL